MPSLQRQRELLRKEYEHEKAEFRRAAETMDVDRKVNMISNTAAASVSFPKTAWGVFPILIFPLL